MKRFFLVLSFLLLAVLAGCVLLLGISGLSSRMREKQSAQLEGKSFSVLGDSLSAYAGYTPEGLTGYYTPENFGVESMWWSIVARETGMEPCVINTGGGTGVTELLEDAGVPTAGNSVRCENLHTQEQTPDVIFVLLGGNDVIQGVPENTIENSYEEMLERMQKAYPSAEIYVCTYYKMPGYLREPMIQLNELIRKIAEKEGIACIDLEDCEISAGDPQDYIQDYNAEEQSGVHANQKGQKIMGETIVSSFFQIRNSK